MEKESVEFRYYEIPADMPLIALQGEEWIREYGNDPMHFHNCLEIGYCYYGQGKVYFGQRAESYGPGSITIVPKNFPHQMMQTDEEPNRWEYLFVDTGRFLRKVFPNYAGMAFGDTANHISTLLRRLNGHSFCISGKQEPELDMLLRLMFEEMRRKERLYRYCMEGFLWSFLMKIARHMENEGQFEEEFAETGLCSEILDRAILDALNYIEEHYMEDFTIKELAGLSHMSPSNFRRKFRSCMHTAPAEYVNLVRIEKACELLKTTEDRVEEIALKTGFHTAGPFIRSFKKLTGYSPLQWKKMEGQSENNLRNYKVSVLKGW